MFLIIVAPLITTQPQSGSVTEGDNVTLSCNASGNPLPAISWTRDGSLVSSGDQRISFEAGNRRLTITNVSRVDSGEYRCVADNSEGNDTSNATTLDVQCKYTSLIKDLTKLPKTEFLSARSSRGFSPVEFRLRSPDVELPQFKFPADQFYQQEISKP